MAENLKDAKSDGGGGGMVNAGALKSYVERVTKLLEERDELTADIKQVYDEAKEAGFVTKILRQIVREARLDSQERNDHYAILDAYRVALGLLADTPLGEAAMRQANKKPGRPRRTAEGDPLH